MPQSTKESVDSGLNVSSLTARPSPEENAASFDFNLKSSSRLSSTSRISCIGTLTGLGPLYLADPYFDPYLDDTAAKYSKLVQTYLDLFAATTGRSLRILCAHPREYCQPWWVKYPKDITKHVSVRTFHKRDERGPDGPRRGFHDRYLITPDTETIITNSLNGWDKAGVTFISLPYEVYRAEAEQLWSMKLEADTERLWVEEIY